MIDPDQVLGPEQPGTSLVVVGDVGKPEKLAEYVSGADGLVMEATYLNDEVEMADVYGHTTAEKVRFACQREWRETIDPDPCLPTLQRRRHTQRSQSRFSEHFFGTGF